jgi:hypothetical protein
MKTLLNTRATDTECTLDARTAIWKSVDGRIYNGTAPLTDRQAIDHLLFHCRACEKQPRCCRAVHAYQEHGRDPDYTGWRDTGAPNPKHCSQRGNHKPRKPLRIAPARDII